MIFNIHTMIIFSHQFAKAFWGEEGLISVSAFETTGSRDSETEDFVFVGDGGIDDSVEKVIPLWQYHLQQMVLEEEPIKYLEQFLKKLNSDT